MKKKGMASIQSNKQDVVSNKGKLDSWPPSSSEAAYCTCSRVPTKFRAFNEHAYTPEMISIGPFHRDKVHLQAMDAHKLRYVDEFLSRLENRVAKLEECVEAISKLEEEIRKCYSEPIILDKESFVEMMIVDGLFIIELFRKNAGEERIHKDDPIFKNVWGLSSLVRDMILLENQLPMFVLECLFNITMAKQQGGKQLSELAIRFFNPLMPREESVLAKYFSTRGKHLLDLLRKTFYDLSLAIWSESFLERYVYSIGTMKLPDSGFKFKKGSNAYSFLNITSRNGVEEIPPVLIQDQTFSFLRNIIAYEQCCGGPFYVTSYVSRMNDLARSSNDVAILREHGIIRNYLSDNGLVSSLFHNLCNEINHVNFSGVYYPGYTQTRLYPNSVFIYRLVLLCAGLIVTTEAFDLLRPIFEPDNSESTLQRCLLNTRLILEFFTFVVVGVAVTAISLNIRIL